MHFLLVKFFSVFVYGSLDYVQIYYNLVLLIYIVVQIFEIVNLANELLPPLPLGTISLPVSSYLFVKGPMLRKSPTSNSGKQEESNGNAVEVSTREKLLNEQPELLRQFGMDLLPVLIQVSFWCTY